jgi:antitoxin (DNA-binding transcriptional repressor) of toxin-antitoxin stability system
MYISQGGFAMGKMVSATEFKAKSLKLIDEMERSGEPLTITRRGKASLTLTARKAGVVRPASLIGCMKGSLTILGDIIGPVDPDWESAWEANNPPELYGAGKAPLTR